MAKKYCVCLLNMFYTTHVCLLRMHVYYTCLSTTHVCLLKMFLYYTYLSTTHVRLLHIFVYYTYLSTIYVCLHNMFVYYSWLYTTHICLLRMIVYYTCLSATHVCLLHLGDGVLLMKLKTSKFIQSFLVTGTPPLVWGHLSKTHAPEKENQDFKVCFFHMYLNDLL